MGSHVSSLLLGSKGPSAFLSLSLSLSLYISGVLFGYHAVGGMLIYTRGKIYAEEPRD